MAAVRVSVEVNCVLCEILNLSQAIAAITVSVIVFVFRCNNDRLHVLKLILVIVT